ncbi:hypothetical protein ZWY2020_040440 [Hordeum vulgare]|nr:hypothetical protein ZWY2020_040440 [Hordeum vulgare]
MIRGGAQRADSCTVHGAGGRGAAGAGNIDDGAGRCAAALRWEDPTVWMLIGNSSLVYLVNPTNFLVTKHTSPLTLQVLRNAKGAVAVVVSILIFKNSMTVMGMLGYGVTIDGVVLYGEAKKRSK